MQSFIQLRHIVGFCFDRGIPVPDEARRLFGMYDAALGRYLAKHGLVLPSMDEMDEACRRALEPMRPNRSAPFVDRHRALDEQEIKSTLRGWVVQEVVARRVSTLCLARAASLTVHNLQKSLKGERNTSVQLWVRIACAAGIPSNKILELAGPDALSDRHPPRRGSGRQGGATGPDRSEIRPDRSGPTGG